jgi:hypothetical protein
MPGMANPSAKSPLPRLALIAGGVLVALFALAWLALAVLFPPPRVKLLVQEQLHHALARDVRFENASLGLFPPVRLTVSRPELAEPGGFERGAAFSADAVYLDLDVLALLARRIRVERLILERPVLHLLLRADGTSNLDSLGAPQPPSNAPAPAMDLDVRTFAIRNGRVLVDDIRAGRRTAFGLGTRMSLSAENGGQRIATAGATDLTELAIGPLSAAKLADLNQGLSKLRFHVEHAGKFDAKSNRLALEKLALSLGRTQLSLSGLVDDVGPHARFDLKARGDHLDFGDVLAWVAVADAPAVKGLSGSGTMAFDLGIRGAAPAPGAAPVIPAVTGWLRVQDASFRYAGAPADVKGLGFEARFAPDSVGIPDLRAMVAGQPVRAQFSAQHFADPLVRFALQGNIDLAAIAPLVAQQAGAADTKLSGHVNVDVHGSGRAKDPGAMALDGRAELRDVGVSKPDLPKPIEHVNGVVLLSPQRAAVQHLSARAGQSSYTLDATVTRPLALMAKPDSVPPAGVTFDFRSPYLDLAELLPTTPGAPFLPNAKGGGTVAIDRLKQGKLDVTHVAAQVALSPAALESPSFSLQGYGGTVSGNAHFDLHDTRKPAYAVKAKVASVQANDILSAWTPAKGLLSGTLDTDIDFSGKGQTPDDVKRTLTLVGLAQLAQGQFGPGPTLEAIAAFVKVPRLHEVKFKDLQLPMRVEQGRLVTDPVNLSGTSGDWKLSGAIGFDGALDYAVSVTLPPDAVAALGARSALAAGALSDDQGRMLLDLRVTGNAKSPRIAWDTRAMRDRLAGRASQALAEQRTKLESDARAAATQALSQRLGLSGDSTQPASGARQLQAARDSLRKSAGGLLKGFFGGAKKPAPADTTKH